MLGAPTPYTVVVCTPDLRTGPDSKGEGIFGQVWVNVSYSLLSGIKKEKKTCCVRHFSLKKIYVDQTLALAHFNGGDAPCVCVRFDHKVNQPKAMHSSHHFLPTTA